MMADDRELQTAFSRVVLMIADGHAHGDIDAVFAAQLFRLALALYAGRRITGLINAALAPSRLDFVRTLHEAGR